jgi:hypothetical protein
MLRSFAQDEFQHAPRAGGVAALVECYGFAKRLREARRS